MHISIFNPTRALSYMWIHLLPFGLSRLILIHRRRLSAKLELTIKEAQHDCEKVIL
jgi:hypothetical protein